MVAIRGFSPLGLLNLGYSAWQIADLMRNMNENSWTQALMTTSLDKGEAPYGWRMVHDCHGGSEDSIFNQQGNASTGYYCGVRTVYPVPWDSSNWATQRNITSIHHDGAHSPGNVWGWVSKHYESTLGEPVPFVPPGTKKMVFFPPSYFAKPLGHVAYSQVPYRQNGLNLQRGHARQPPLPPNLVKHKRVPPGPGVKEAKVNTKPGYARVVSAIFHTVTEVNDLAKAYAQALPEDLKKQFYKEKGWAKKYQFLWKHFGKADLDQFVKNVIVNEVVDQLMGRASARVQKKFTRPGVPYLSPTWGPALRGQFPEDVPPKTPWDWLADQLPETDVFPDAWSRPHTPGQKD